MDSNQAEIPMYERLASRCGSTGREPFSQIEVWTAFRMAGHSEHISNFLRPDLVPRLQVLLSKLNKFLDR
jgi:hypothetical protein